VVGRCGGEVDEDVVEFDRWCSGFGFVVDVDGGEEDGMNDSARVPEKRTMLTASATGRTAESGLGQFRLRVVSMPMVITSERSTSMRAWRRPSSVPVVPGPYQKPSSAGITRQLLKMGNSSPSAISLTLISPIQSGLLPELRTSVREPRIASSCLASARSWAIVCAIKTLNQSRLSGWWPLTL
jgi:hypothetical protein